MKKFFAMLVVVWTLLFMPAAQAEVRTYDGVGEYLMSDFETFDVAQQRAKQRAEQNACEQAGVYVESRTEVRNAQVTKDEIITMTSGILKIVEVQFKREFVDDNTTRIRATVKAQIDSDDINKWLAKGAQERATLVAQNEALRQSVAEQDKQIADLKKQLADVKTQADRERIEREITDEDKKFFPNQKERIISKNFAEFTHAVGFTPLYIPIEWDYNIHGLSANNGVAEIRYGKYFEPKVSLTVKTYKRTDGEGLADISGVTGVKWRVHTTTGTTIYIAKISETQQVAAWAVGHYTFAVKAKNLSYADFYALIVYKLVDLSTHYYLD